MSRPLKILVTTKSLFFSDEIKALNGKGHNVQPLVDENGLWPEQYDVILGETCHKMTPELLPYLDEAVKTARKRKYGPQKKGVSDD